MQVQETKRRNKIKGEQEYATGWTKATSQDRERTRERKREREREREERERQVRATAVSYVITSCSDTKHTCVRKTVS